ncbi:hypothetical protein [Streptomyces sp. NPDC021212]|uniref:hypothetical protein n=1 Tax=Streptomyces sp. NPDC021212 TaxID=3365118 RepID=UPI00379E609D
MRLTSELRTIAQGEQAPGLRAELAARRDIVESSFPAGIGRSVIDEGFSMDRGTLQRTDKRRCRWVTRVTDALIGFQYDRCLIAQPITPGDSAAVDHVFPCSLR